MREIKKEKISETIHRLTAEYVVRNATPASIITITRVELSPTGKESKIYFTTLPDSQQDTALKFLERKKSELKFYVRDNSRINFIPHLDFKIDYGERNRQHLDTLS